MRTYILTSYEPPPQWGQEKYQEVSFYSDGSHYGYLFVKDGQAESLSFNFDSQTSDQAVFTAICEIWERFSKDRSLENILRGMEAVAYDRELPPHMKNIL
mgnify:CR=1 FL=1